MATPTENYAFAFNGWLFGGPGQGVQVLEVDGLEDMPSLRVQDDTRGFQDGMFTGRDFLNGRVITFTLQIMNNASGTMQSYLAELKSNLQYQQQGTGVLQFLLPGRALQRVNARVRRRAIKLDPEYSYGKAIAIVEMFCPDPRIYDDTLQTTVLTPTNLVGRTYNRTYNLRYLNPASGTSAFGSFINSGNVTVYPKITLSGQMFYPEIVNITTGDSITVNYYLGSSDVLVLDPDLRSVTYNGNPARNLIGNGSDWFGFPPGTTTVGIVVPTVVAGASVTIQHRNGYV